jgi:hypothetical protein
MMPPPSEAESVEKGTQVEEDTGRETQAEEDFGA